MELLPISNDAVLKLYTFDYPVKLQVSFVTWQKKHCYLRLSDKNSVSPVIVIQNVAEEIIIGDNLIVHKARWNVRHSNASKTPSLMDSEFSHLIITGYSIPTRELENERVFTKKSWNYLQSLQLMKKAMDKNHFDCQKSGNNLVLVKHIDAYIKALNKNNIPGTELRMRGNREFEKREYKEAVHFYEKAKCLLGYDAGIWSNCSLAYQRMGENEKSLSDGLIALKLDPYSIKYYHRVSYAYKCLQQYELAFRIIRAGLFLVGACKEFTTLFGAIRNEISEVIGITAMLKINFKTLIAIGEQANMETQLLKKAKIRAASETPDSGVTDQEQNKLPGSAKSLTKLLTEVCATESTSSWFLRHPSAFAEFMEELFVEKLPPRVKYTQKQVCDANNMFFEGSYAEAMLKYTELCNSITPNLCKSELSVLHYLTSLCNILLVHKDGFEDDFRHSLWFARVLQEWLYTHCMLVADNQKILDSSGMKKNCDQCGLCLLNEGLSDNQGVELLMKTIPLHYVTAVVSLKKDDQTANIPQPRKKPTNVQPTNAQASEKDVELMEYMRMKALKYVCKHTAEECSGIIATECEVVQNASAPAPSNSTENVKVKSKNKQTIKKKPLPPKKNKTTKGGKKNKRKVKKTSNAQQKQGAAKRRNNDDSNKESESDSLSDMGDDDNEGENDCEMLTDDDISLGYNPKREADLNGSPKSEESTTISEGQMEILYDFMEDWMKERGALKCDDTRLANYVAESFPENALSYVKSSSVEDFLVKSGRFVASDSAICVKGRASDGDTLAATTIFRCFKNSKFILSDNLKSRKTHKLNKYSQFANLTNIKESSLVTPSNVQKCITNGNMTKKQKSSNMDLDDFKDDIQSISRSLNESNISKVSNAGSDVTTAKNNNSNQNPTTKSKKASKTPASANKEKPIKTNNLSFPIDTSNSLAASYSLATSSTDEKNSRKLSADNNNLRLMSEVQELNEKLLKSEKELKAKTAEVHNTQKQANELYNKLQTITEEYDKYQLHQRFEFRQLEEDKADLQKHLQTEKGSYSSVRVANETMIETLRKEVDVLTFKLGRSSNELKEKNNIIEQGANLQAVLMKRLKTADKEYITLKNDIYEFVCNREISRLDSEMKVLGFLPTSVLSPSILCEAVGLWQKVKQHITNLLQIEQKKIHDICDSMNGEKYNPINYDGIANMNIPDAYLSLLFEQQNIMKESIVAPIPIHLPPSTQHPTSTRDTASPAISPFTEMSRQTAFAATPFASTVVSSGLQPMSTASGGAYGGFDAAVGGASRLPGYAEPPVPQQDRVVLRDKIKEIWQNNKQSKMPPPVLPTTFDVPKEIPNPIVRPVPQLGTYHQAGLFNRSSPLDSFTNESYAKIIDGYIEKYGTIYTQEEIAKAVIEMKEKYRGRFSGMSMEAVYACLHDILKSKRNPWGPADNKIRDIWQIQEPCPICLTTMAGDQKLVDLSCDHMFHKSCLSTWIKTNSTCPTCRKVITASF